MTPTSSDNAWRPNQLRPTARLERWYALVLVGLLVVLPIANYFTIKNLNLVANIALILVGISTIAEYMFKRWSAAPLKALVARHPDRRTHAVDFEIKLADCTLGTDSGVVWLQDGALVFEGFRTEFCLSSVDLTLAIKSGKMCSVALRRSGQTYSLEFRVARDFRKDVDAFDDLVAALRAWIGSKPAVDREILPPLSLQPEEALAQNYLRRPVAALIGSICMLTALGLGGAILGPEIRFALYASVGLISTLVLILSAALIPMHSRQAKCQRRVLGAAGSEPAESR